MTRYLLFSILLPLSFFMSVMPSSAQTTKILTLDEVVELAREQSIDAMIAKHQFLSAYWEYRSFKARQLPSLVLGLNIPIFAHSIAALQDPQTGAYNYVDQFSMRNNVSLAVNQRIAATGGTLSLYSSLERLDQFAPTRYTRYSSQAISLEYRQPIFGTFNQMKWDRKIAPEIYDRGKFRYLESMESVAQTAARYFFALAMEQQNSYIVHQNLTNTQNLYEIAQERFKIGAITQNDLMQLELNMTNAGLDVNRSEISLRIAKFNMASYLGYNQTVDIELILPDQLPGIRLEFPQIFQLSMSNTSFSADMKIALLQAESNVARARANRGMSMDLFTQFGLNQTGSDMGESYRRPLDQENVRIGMSIPLFDWGVGRGGVRQAESLQNVVVAQQDQVLIAHEQEILLSVMEFNNQQDQCFMAERADSIARSRYEIATQLFQAGSMTVLEFTNAQKEKDESMKRYITELSNYWNYYYSIQKITLYDFRNRKNISTDFDELIQE